MNSQVKTRDPYMMARKKEIMRVIQINDNQRLAKESKLADFSASTIGCIYNESVFPKLIPLPSPVLKSPPASLKLI